MDESAARWLRSFAHRRAVPLPELDGSFGDTCPAAALEVARIVWTRRLVNESLSVDLARQLIDVAARLAALDPIVVDALARLEADEVNHVTLVGRVLARLGITGAKPAAVPQAADERPELAFARLVLTGLCVCETVSAARFAAVREHTDLASFRACIELFHRDELTHAELGFVLLPEAIDRLRVSRGAATSDVLLDELCGAFGHLDRVVGLELERTGGPPPARPQPLDNPGVVEPAIDARAFYHAIHQEIVPRLERAGLPAQVAWEHRR